MMRITIAVFAVMLALGCPAVAQTPAPVLKANVTVTSDVVRIGDLIDNAGPVSDVPIFRAPDLGTTGTVATDRIVDAIRSHQLIGIDTRGLADVIVVRASRAIAAQEISGRIAQALAGQYGFGQAQNIQINFDHDVRTLQVEPTVTGNLQVLALAYDPRTTRFDVTFDLPSSVELRRQSARYTGTAIETADTVAVEHPVEHGEVLKASDLTILRRPKAEGGGATDINAVVGLAARHQLHPGQPLRAADLMKPEVVQRNDTVTIVYQAPGVTLTLRGQAQDAGALGDTINVLNVESKRVVQGTVVGPGRVTVSAITTRVVENTSERHE
jgi:flagellar basal body P-ring formation protein FlgA